jgi:hypothetical protein
MKPAGGGEKMPLRDQNKIRYCGNPELGYYLFIESKKARSQTAGGFFCV